MDAILGASYVFLIGGSRRTSSLEGIQRSLCRFFYFCSSGSYVKNRLLVTFAGLDTQDQTPFPYCSVMICCGVGQVFQSLGIQKRPFALSQGKASLDVQLENRHATRVLLMVILNIPQSKKFLRGPQHQSLELRTVQEIRRKWVFKARGMRSVLCVTLNCTWLLGYGLGARCIMLCVLTCIHPDYAMKHPGL